MRFAPKIGLIFREGLNRSLQLIKRTVAGKFRLEDGDGQAEVVTRDVLLANWRDGRWVIDDKSLSAASKAVYTAIPHDLKSLPEAEQKAIKERLRYLLAIERAFRKAGGSFISTVAPLQREITAAAERFKDSNPPSPATVKRWWNRFSPTRCVMKLRDGRKNSGQRRDPRAFGVFEEVINEVFLTPQKVQILRVYEGTKRKLDRINTAVSADERIGVPSRATIYRWVATLYYSLVLKAREGKRISEKELRIAQDGVKVDHILERVEIDHTPLDLMVIDRVTKLVLGRPWLTLAIDRKSRCILGFFISFSPPSAYSVLACLRRAILPKDDLLKRFPRVRGQWKCLGIMDQIVVDNGMELHAADLEIAALEMGIEVLYAGVAHPEMKGAVERFFRTLAEDLIHELPGTMFSNPKQRGDYPSEAKAAIDMETLVYLVVKWIVDVYHCRPHRGLGGKSPNQVWDELEPARVIELPVYPKQLDVIAGRTAHPTIFHYGVQVDNLFYNSPQLHEIPEEDGGRPVVEARYSEDSVASVFVRDPRDDEFFEVPCTNRAYANGLNRAVHRLVVAQARKRYGDAWTQSHLLEMRAEIEEMVADAIKAKKLWDRKRGARALMHDSEAVFESTTTEEVVSLDDPMPTASDYADVTEEDMDGIEAYPVVGLISPEEETV